MEACILYFSVVFIVKLYFINFKNSLLYLTEMLSNPSEFKQQEWRDLTASVQRCSDYF